MPLPLHGYGAGLPDIIDRKELGILNVKIIITLSDTDDALGPKEFDKPHSAVEKREPG